MPWMGLMVTAIDDAGGVVPSSGGSPLIGPGGLAGKAMWFAELPAHRLVFAGLVRDLARGAERRHAAGRRERAS